MRPTSAMAPGVVSGGGDGSSEAWNQHQALHSCSNENPRRGLEIVPRLLTAKNGGVGGSLLPMSFDNPELPVATATFRI